MPNRARAKGVYTGMKRNRPPPWRAIELFLFVSLVVLATFLLWGERIDAWTRGAFFADANQGSWLAFLAAIAVSGAFFLIRCRVAPKPDARR